jgi:hypothetical protein
VPVEVELDFGEAFVGAEKIPQPELFKYALKEDVGEQLVL